MTWPAGAALTAAATSEQSFSNWPRSWSSRSWAESWGWSFIGLPCEGGAEDGRAPRHPPHILRGGYDFPEDLPHRVSRLLSDKSNGRRVCGGYWLPAPLPSKNRLLQPHLQPRPGRLLPTADSKLVLPPRAPLG